MNCAAAQVARIKDRFAITQVVLVGDRGMLTAARLRPDDWPPRRKELQARRR